MIMFLAAMFSWFFISVVLRFNLVLIHVLIIALVMVALGGPEREQFSTATVCVSLWARVPRAGVMVWNDYWFGPAMLSMQFGMSLWVFWAWPFAIFIIGWHNFTTASVILVHDRTIWFCVGLRIYGMSMPSRYFPSRPLLIIVAFLRVIRITRVGVMVVLGHWTLLIFDSLLIGRHGRLHFTLRTSYDIMFLF